MQPALDSLIGRPPLGGAARASLARRLLALLSGLLALVSLALSPIQAGQPPAETAQQVPASRLARNVAIISVHGPIDERGVMASSIRRRIEMAHRAGADAIVFDINTPGGSVDTSLRISNAIKQSPVANTVAWINPDAISGGAIVALACREIIVNDPAKMGDAMPIMITPWGGPASIRDTELLKKVLPVLVSEVVDSVRRHNLTFGAYSWDEYLAQSIVANDVELWFVRNPSTGARLCIDRREFEMLFPGRSPDALPARLAGAPGTGGAGPQPAPSSQPGRVNVPAPSGSAKLAAVAPDVAVSSPTLRPTLTPADAGQWELIDRVTDGSAAALFNAADMLHYGLAANASTTVAGVVVPVPIRTEADVMAFFGASNIRRYDRTWSEGLVLFMTNMIVRGVLMVIFLVALFGEMTNPGAMLPGAIALVALLALLAPPLLIGMAGWWEVAAILAGIALIGLEAFVIPGFGVPGILGLFLLFAGLVGTFVPNSGGAFPGSGEGRNDLLWGAVTMILSFATAGVSIYMISKHFASLPLLGLLVLRSNPPEDEDETGDTLLSAMGEDEPAVAVGDTGATITPMRPAGRVQVGERVIDAVAEFGFIESGRAVRVVNVSAMRVGVEEIS